MAIEYGNRSRIVIARTNFCFVLILLSSFPVKFFFKKMDSKHLSTKALLFINIIAISHIATALPSFGFGAKLETALEVLILHNNDMHSRFEQTGQYSTQCHPNEVAGNQCYGGFARVSTLLKKYRNAASNGGPPVLYLNAGDTYTGTPYFSLFRHKIVSDFLNMLKPDAAVSRYIVCIDDKCD